MTKSQYREDIITNNDQFLKSILRVIQFSQGQFRLILVRCNYGELRDPIILKLRELSPIPIHEFHLPESAKSLYMAIREEVENNQPQALLVLGLESVKDIKNVLTSSHYIREEFPKKFPFPLFLWVNDEVLRKFLRLVPDFASWATTIEFELTTDELRDLLRQKIENIFAKEDTINIQNCWEFNRACLDWQQRGETLEAELDASLEFIRGKENFAKDNIDDALTHYRHSNQFWKKVENLERRGILLVNIARCYNRKAEQNRRKRHDYWQKSLEYLQDGIELFESAQRWDLVLRYISQLCTVLRRLENWKELESLAQKALYFCQNKKPVGAKHSRDQLSGESKGYIPNASPRKQAQYYGFLAEAAQGRSDYTKAKRLARQTLESLAEIPNCQPYEKCLSRFVLAQAEWHFGQKAEAISHLEQVREECQPQEDPELYIKSLEELRSLYFEAGEYQKAFQIKQEIRAIEYQYGFKSFVGAGLLPPQPRSQEVIVPNQEQINREIAASGREGDVKKILERINNNQIRLIVIHGYSGVGKSSLLTAGLIPALQWNSIEGRDFLPVLVRVYSNWVGELGNVLAKALRETARILDPPQPPLIREEDLDSLKAILAQLRTNSNENRITVLIFDQFEEFFFACTDKKERRIFFEFFRDCLDISFVKVVLSLREDYVHYLFEGEQFNLDAIDNNILDKDVRYPLRNFLPEEAKGVIENMTARSHFALDEELLNELVQDLAGDLGEIRPIELQIVGAQLEADEIITLAKYQEKYGSKKTLVEKWLNAVIKDCGNKNKQATELVLYFLTNDKDTRETRTLEQLERDFQMEDFGFTVEILEFVLLALVGSGLVLKIPDTPMPSYQLVHDYLVSFIRQLQQARDVEARKQDKLERQYLENQLSEVLSENTDLKNQLSESHLQEANLKNQLSEMRSQKDYVENQLSKDQSEKNDLKIWQQQARKAYQEQQQWRKEYLKVYRENQKLEQGSQKIDRENKLLKQQLEKAYLNNQLLEQQARQAAIVKYGLVAIAILVVAVAGQFFYIGRLNDENELVKAKLEQKTISNISPGQFWNRICRNGSLIGSAADVMFACEKAVSLDPKNGDFRDSRGLARALTGDRKGAIEDFQYSITVSDDFIERSKRQRWINTLRNSNNILTQDELQKLSAE